MTEKSYLDKKNVQDNINIYRSHVRQSINRFIQVIKTIDTKMLLMKKTVIFTVFFHLKGQASSIKS